MERKPAPFWLDRDKKTSFDRLKGEVKADVAIVGAGMVGLHTAFQLRNAGLKVVLLEARSIGRQATGRSTAKVTSQHGLRLATLARNFGQDNAKLYVIANEKGKDSIANIASSMTERACLEEKDAYVYAESDEEAEKLRQEADIALSAGVAASFIEHPALPVKSSGALRFARQYQFDPYLYLCGLAHLVSESGVSVYENSRVHEISTNKPHRLTLIDSDAAVAADRVVVATQMPVIPQGLFFTKAFPIAHPMAAAPLPEDVEIDGMFINTGAPARSFRTAMRDGEKFIIAVGAEFKTGDRAEEEKAVQDLLAFLRNNFSVKEPSHLWVNEDFRTVDGLSYIGQASGSQPDLLVAVGFDAWGVTQGAVAGEILAAHVLGENHPLAGLFDATRVKPIAGGPSFIFENVKNAGRLVRRFHSADKVSLEELAAGEGCVIDHDGERLAVSRTEDGSLIAHSAVCTHMGCLVGWNGLDRTWDCPCHGSRFDEFGEVLSGPAVHAMETKELSFGGTRIKTRPVDRELRQH